ncbi:hypothetical protein PoB_000668200 [Plakobranchus ocellatus]|uniref:Uncharacterized protein n=1 Tax=Plakobranchus ocellatus TaxID=259542 RepID=A0AAV3YBE3_9GAST|nr:hypothetical protein PoB_000668200 [Plakobranchus ocellatus]
MDGNMAVIRVMPRCPVEAPAKNIWLQPLLYLLTVTRCRLLHKVPATSNHEQKLKGHHHASTNGLFQGHQNFLKMTSDNI